MEFEEGYSPKPWEVAGFELIGYRQEDGSIRLGNEKGTHLPDFPKEVEAFGVVYCLEEVRKNKDEYNLSPDHEGYRIEWGVYC
jgi:hypothetical protein